MKTTKYLALLVLAATLCAGAPARADDWGTIDLVNTGAEPNATGHATLTNVVGPYWSLVWTGETYVAYEVYFGDLSVDGGGLTPGANYVCDVAVPSGAERAIPFAAKKSGASGTLDFWFSSSSDVGPIPSWINVYRVDGDNLVLVLALQYP